MSLAGLSLEQAPPISVPFRFFYGAPLFGLLAALVLLAAGPEGVASRWTPALLAATHLLTLGFMAMVMTGALFQMLPVVAGAVVPRPRLAAWAVHLPLTAGTLFLAAAFLFRWRPAFGPAMVLLGGAFALFLVLAIYSLARAPARNATVRAIWLALAALGLTAALGIALAGALAGRWSLAAPGLVELHLLWGLLGWVGLLVAGVAYQVVPMFQLTPIYPPSFSRWLAPLAAALLLAYSAALAVGAGAGWLALIGAGLAAAFAAFAIMTLALQRRRKRRLSDPTLQFWRLAMASLLAAALLWAAGRLAPLPERAYALGLAVLFLVGFGVSVIDGMLYKIVPFLVWFHLQSRASQPAAVPHMKAIIPEGRARLQLRLHAAALVLLLGCAAWPPLVYPAGLAFGASALSLGANLLVAGRCYRAIASAG